MVEALGGQGVFIRSLGVPSGPCGTWGAGGLHQTPGGPFRFLGVLSDPWGSLQIHETLRGQGEALGGQGFFIRPLGVPSDPHQIPGGPLRSLWCLGGRGRHLGGGGSS